MKKNMLKVIFFFLIVAVRSFSIIDDEINEIFQIESSKNKELILEQEVRAETFDPVLVRDTYSKRLIDYLYQQLFKIDENGNVHSCTTPECPICRVFGRGAGDSEIAKSGPTRISVKDAYLTEESREILEKLREKVGFDTEWKYENNINRLTSKATPRNSERIPAGIKFEFSISYKVFDMNDNGKLDEELFEKVVLKGLKTLLIEGIGGGVSRGNGQIRFVKLDVDGESYIDKIENISIR